MPLLQIQSLDELLKTVAKQKAMSIKAGRELSHEMNTTAMLYKPDHTLSEVSSMEISRRVESLIHKYSQLPTLTEFYTHPSWDEGFIWGGSFGVSAIIGTVFMQTLGEIFPEFRQIVRSVTLKVLEIHYASIDSTDEAPAVIDQILPAMRFVIKDTDGHEIIGAAKEKHIYNRVQALLEVMAKTLLSYGILEEVQEEQQEEGQICAKLTPMGVRVYLHLRDVETYIQEVAALYPQLVEEKTTNNSIIL